MESKNSKVSIIVLANGDIGTIKNSKLIRRLRNDYIVYYRNKLINLNIINMYVICSKTFRVVR
jgi:hypothetical protein